MHNIMTPFGDGAKLVLVKRSHGSGYILIFVDGHGYSHGVAASGLTDPDGNELAWLGESAALHHGIKFEREESR